VTITGGVPVTIFCVDYSVTRSVNIKVLSDQQVADLNWAANNVRYIAETSNIMIQAQQIWDALPTEQILQDVRDGIASGVKLVPTVDQVGFVHTHATGNYAFYAILSGVRHDVAQYDLNAATIADLLTDLIVDLLK